MAKLVAQSGPTTGREYPLTKPVMVLGRQSTSDIQVVDGMASRHQCEIRREGRFYSLVDLGSRNGTQLNGRKVGERLLFFGDRIRIGEVELLFVKEPGDVELKDLLTRYELQDKIGEGGMGLVFKAVQRSMARQVALKVLSPRFALNEKWVEQFINEARAAGKLNHQNIIQVHDVSSENGIHFFSMEFVDGPTCMQMLRQHGTLEPEAALEIVRQVARALDYAHSQRLIHHDIKPDNIMVGSNEVVKLADLGISKSFDEAKGENGSGKLMGTPHYLAPEAAMGQAVDHRIDIYALGATLFHLLTGRPPYRGTDATAILKAHISEQVPRPSDVVPTLPAELDVLVMRMLAKDPAARPQQAKEIDSEIERILAGKGIATGQPGRETVVLKRYASTVVSPGAAGDAGSASQAVQTRRPPLIPIAIAVVAVAATALLLMRGRPADANSSSPAPRSDGPVAPVPSVATTTPVVVAPPANASEAKSEAILTEIERALMRPSDQIPYADLPKRLAEVPESGLDVGIASRRKRVATAVAGALERHRQEQTVDAFNAMQAEITQLSGSRDYAAALARLDGFAGKAEPFIAERHSSAVDAVKAERDRYVSDSQDQIRQLLIHRDRPGLAAYGNTLPASWKTGVIADAVAAAIAKLEGERNAALADIATQADRCLATWNLSGLEDLAKQRKADIEGSPVAERIQRHRATLTVLADLPPAIAARLAQVQSVRFSGVLAGLADPDIVGSDRVEGLELREAGGGAVRMRWDRIKPAELRKITDLVLKADGKRFADAIAALEAK